MTYNSPLPTESPSSLKIQCGLENFSTTFYSGKIFPKSVKSTQHMKGKQARTVEDVVNLFSIGE